VSEIKASFIDRVIGAVSPAWALKRLAAKAQLEAITADRTHKAARKDRLSNDWSTSTTLTPEEMFGADRLPLLARSRRLEYENDIAASVANAVIVNVIGTGIRPQSKAAGKAFARDAEALWNEWVKQKNCDVTGCSTFFDLQRLVLRRWLFDGEFFVHHVVPQGKPSGEMLVPYQIQLIDPLMVQSPFSLRSAQNVYSGIEIDNFSRPIAYHVLQGYGSQAPANQTTVIPAQDMLHGFTKILPTQIRGISPFAPALQRIRDTTEFIDAELIAARIAACFALFITTSAPSAALGRLDLDDDGQPIEGLKPGMSVYLRPGEDVKTATPGRPDTTAKEFIETQQRLVAGAMGLSYELLARDLSKVTFSSARQGHLEDRRAFSVIQQFIIDHFCQPVWEEFLKWAVMSGKLKARSFSSRPQDYLPARWIAPGWGWIDPLKEAQANNLGLDRGYITLSQICGQLGLDWQEVLDQRRKEVEYAKSIGLTVVDPAAQQGGDPPNGSDEDMGPTEE